MVNLRYPTSAFSWLANVYDVSFFLRFWCLNNYQGLHYSLPVGLYPFLKLIHHSFVDYPQILCAIAIHSHGNRACFIDTINHQTIAGPWLPHPLLSIHVCLPLPHLSLWWPSCIRWERRGNLANSWIFLLSSVPALWGAKGRGYGTWPSPQNTLNMIYMCAYIYILIDCLANFSQHDLSLFSLMVKFLSEQLHSFLSFMNKHSAQAAVTGSSVDLSWPGLICLIL